MKRHSWNTLKSRFTLLAAPLILVASNASFSQAQFDLGGALSGALGGGQLRGAVQQMSRGMSNPTNRSTLGSTLGYFPNVGGNQITNMGSATVRLPFQSGGTRVYEPQKPNCPPSQNIGTPIYYPPVNSTPSQPAPISAPVPVATRVQPPAPAEAVAPEVLKARKLVDEARQLFLQGKYTEAEPKLEELVALAAEDTNAYQFRSFNHFAQADYDAAAADAYDAILLGNTWDWDTVYDLYKNVDTYQSQLRKLESQATAESTMSNHFLLGYQYLVLGHLARGQKELEKVLVIAPEEPLVTKLVDVVAQMQAAKK